MNLGSVTLLGSALPGKRNKSGVKEGAGKFVGRCGTPSLPLETKWKWSRAFRRLFWKATESLVPRKFMVRQGRKEETAFIYQLSGCTEECLHPQGVNSKALKKKFFFKQFKNCFLFPEKVSEAKGTFWDMTWWRSTPRVAVLCPLEVRRSPSRIGHWQQLLKKKWPKLVIGEAQKSWSAVRGIWNESRVLYSH